MEGVILYKVGNERKVFRGSNNECLLFIKGLKTEDIGLVLEDVNDDLLELLGLI